MIRTQDIPTKEAIKAVLLSCESGIASMASAAMHLALPYDACVGSDVWRNAGMWSYRGASAVIAPNGDIDLAVEVAYNFALETHRPGDEYLDLSAGPKGWVKIADSGSSKIPFGLSILTGQAFIADRYSAEEYMVQAVEFIFAGGKSHELDEKEETLSEFAARMGVSEETAAKTMKALFKA